MSQHKHLMFYLYFTILQLFCTLSIIQDYFTFTGPAILLEADALCRPIDIFERFQDEVC
jgi:hypothetical protein